MEAGAGLAPVLLDRRDEQAVLRTAFHRAGSGHGSTCVVTGPPGMGKTSLVLTLIQQAHEAGWQVISGRGSQLEQEFAFGVVRQMLASAAIMRDRSVGDPAPAPAPERRSERTLVDVLSEHVEPVSGGRSAASEFQLLHELYWWVVAHGDDGPVLLVADDAQWADLSSLRFFRFLALRADHLPILLVVSARYPEESHRAEIIAALSADATSSVVELRALGRDAVEALASDRLGAPDEAFVNAARRVSGGNPLMLTELLGELQQQGIAPTEAAVPLIERIGPMAIQRHVSARLLGQAPSYRQLTQALAVLGPGASVGLVARLADVSADEADAAVDGLIALDLVTLDDGLAFSHPLLAAAAYRAIAPRRRETEHLRAAALLQEDGAPAERIAAHYLEVTPSGAAERVLVLGAAALEARRRGSPDSAAVYLRRAMEEPPPRSLQSEIARQLGNCEAYTLDWTAAERHLRAAVERAESGQHRALAAFSLGRYLEVTQRAGEGARVLEDAIARLRDDVAPLRLRMAAELAGYCAVVLARRTEWPQALRTLDEASPSQWRPLARVRLAHSALMDAMAGASAEEVAAQAEAGLEDGLLAPDLSALYVAVTALMATGHLTESTRYLRRATSWARESGLAVAESIGRSFLAVLAVRRGDLVDAQAELDAGWQLAGDDHSVPGLIGGQLEVFVERGRADDADHLLTRHPITAQMTETCHGMRAVFGRARHRSATGDHEAALADYELLGELYSRWQADALLDHPWRSGAARSLLALGRRERAAELVQEELALAQSFGASRPLGVVLQVAADVHSDDALQLSGQAVEVLSGGESRLELARAQAQLGRLRVRHGDRRRGRELLMDSLEGAMKCGADAMSRSVRRDLMSAGGRPPRPERSGLGSLTPTERRVAALLAKQMSNREIARELYVTEKTVEKHVGGVLRKLGVSSRHDVSTAVAHDWAGSTFLV